MCSSRHVNERAAPIRDLVCSRVLWPENGLKNNGSNIENEFYTENTIDHCVTLKEHLHTVALQFTKLESTVNTPH